MLFTLQFDPATYRRKSVAIACRRFGGTHNHSRISTILESIHSDLNLDSKNIVATVTDNASNFRKAFQVFGVTIDEDLYEGIVSVHI